MPDLLIELFSEEIPARMQPKARDDLRRLVTEGLVAAGLTYAGAGAFSTPRRLVLAVEELDAASRPVREERKGPRTDAPPAAVEGFLRSTGLTLEQLERRDEKKGQVFFAVVEKPGRPAADIVAEVLEGVIRSFPWPKSMRWGAGSLRWVRPLHSILCLLSDEAGATVVPLSVDGIVAGAATRGHRFMAPGPFTVSGFDDYRAKLKRAFVMLDAAEREAQVWHDATTQAFALGLEVVPDAALLTEVAGLVEWPVVLMGQIGEDFLGLPPEVLQTSMREHQKFFSVKNPRTGRIERFVTVANRETADGGATVLAGNQKVLSARLSDAAFFYENDLRVAISEKMKPWAEGLKSVIFHAKLGSQAERIDRIAALALELAPACRADPGKTERAARLAKLDLRSSMVGEFPELQGVMGRYYALQAGEPTAVADAARDHWRPKGEGDSVPTDPVAVAVALADKLDTLCGFWWINEKPTGSKDPFALRRAALGFVRLLLANQIRLSMLEVILLGYEPFNWVLTREILDEEEEWKNESARWFGISAEEAEALRSKIQASERAKSGKGNLLDLKVDWANLRHPGADLLAFLHDRLKVYLRDMGIRHDVIDACLAMPGNDDLALLVKRAEALSVFLATEDGANLLQGFKRANNILTQAEAKDGVEYSYGADPKFAETPEERALFTALDTAEAALAPALAAEDFAAAMAALAALRAPVDAFFTAVQVNSDNQIIRRNRLNLLHRIRALCAQVVDLTRIEG